MAETAAAAPGCGWIVSRAALAAALSAPRARVAESSRAAATATPTGIRVEHLPVAVQEASLRGQGLLPAQGDTLEDIEIRSIRQAMERAEGNRTRAAALLGVTRRTLGYRIGKYGLEFPGRASEAPRGGAPRTPLRVSPKPMEIDKRA